MDVKVLDNKKIDATQGQFSAGLCGERQHVEKELEIILEKLNFNTPDDNQLVGRIRALVFDTLDFYSYSTAVSIVINISGTGVPEPTRTVEVAVRPLWGFCK